MEATAASVDKAEIAKFSAMADQWWDERGKFAPLHRMNPVRIGYIKDVTDSLPGKTLLDIGCGGGLIAEPMTRLGAHVTGIDASARNIEVAKLHAEQADLAIDYRATTAEALAASGMQFDIVLALEIIEHVANRDSFMRACAKLVKPGGKLIVSTLNRTAKSYALAIIGAEYILRWLPRGTHDWQQFMRPSELLALLEKHGAKNPSMSGMVYQPITREWRLDARDVSVNYIVTATR